MPDAPQERDVALRLLDRLQINEHDLTQRTTSPDFSFNFSGFQVGLEVTECTPSEVHRARKIASDTGGFPCFMTSKLSVRPPDAPVRSKDEIRNDMSPFGCGAFVLKDDHLKNWCAHIAVAVSKKQAKFSKYEKFDRNWLLVWDGEGIENDYYTAVRIPSMLLDALCALPPHEDFNAIYITSGDYMFEMTSGGLRVAHPLSDHYNEYFARSAQAPEVGATT